MAHGSVKPESDRFTKTVLATDLDEPMQFEIFADGRVLFVERRGKVRLYDPSSGAVSTIADIPVSVGYYSETGEELEPTGEDGMQGIAIDPNHAENHWIYLFYSPSGDNGSILARYTWSGGTIDTTSKKVLLKVPNQRISCCHLGGGLVFDRDGNLLISTGDNTPNDPRGYSPMDERPGRQRYDSQRSAGNTNDLRGKILRIRPESDGTYSIPPGNLFPPGTPRTRPEIYTMGNRNPWRLSIDSRTGWLYWGEVGPSGTEDSVGMGPRSYDEFNQAREAGNYGWPYFIADNKAYWEYDYATKESGSKFDPARPVNDSPNSSGLRELPSARPALIWYPQSRGGKFPIPGSGSNSAVGGPIYHRADLDNPERPFPEYYEGKWLITDWTRGWIMAVTLDQQGAFGSMEEFAPHVQLAGPIDMEFGPEGDLYVLEYGRTPYQRNSDAKLSRIEYNAGNRQPVVQVSANRTASAAPATIQLSSAGTTDSDGDSLSYEWVVSSGSTALQKLIEPDVTITLQDPGTYRAQLTVSDGHTRVSSDPIEIAVGNAPPVVTFDFHGDNKSFFFDGETIQYLVEVTDFEDGRSSDGTIEPSRIAVDVEHVSSISSVLSTLSALRAVAASVPINRVIARQLMSASDCATCHTQDTQLVGPALADIARKYMADDDAVGYLAQKIVEGGTGVWGAAAMPAHPAFEAQEARTIAEYILSLSQPSARARQPLDGTVTATAASSAPSTGIGPFASPQRGAYVFRASYTDRGTADADPQSSTAVIVLRNPVFSVAELNRTGGMEINHRIITRYSTATPKEVNAYLGVDSVDLTGITGVAVYAPSEFDASGDGRIEVRLGSPSGELIGETRLRFEAAENALERFPARAVIDIEAQTGLDEVYVVLAGLETATLGVIELGSLEFVAN